MLARRFVLSAVTIIAGVLLVGLTTLQILAAPLGVPASQTGAEVGVCTWLGCKSGAVSYSQDDAGNIGGSNSCRPQLEAAGFRGTFFYDGMTTQPWMAALSAAGHEIGSHLVSHDLNCATPPSCFPNCTPQSLWQTPYTPADVTAFRQNQIEPNIAAIEAGTGRPVVSMAWACGNTDAARRAAAQYYVTGARGYYVDGINNLTWVYDVNQATPAEFMNLNADLYFSPALVDRAINEGAWEIVTVHDYCEGIDYIKSKRDGLWVAPVGEVLKYIRVRNAAQFSNYSRSGTTISFDAAHNLGTFQRQKADGVALLPSVYDNPVTLQTHILDTDNVLGVQVNGIPVAFSIKTITGTRYVLFDTSLDSTRHVIVTLGGGAPPPSTLWSDSMTPAVATSNDASAIEVGVKFRSSVAGHITGVRFYKGISNTGTHIGNLWTSDGTLLATATFANETASGWQTVTFANPIPITANTAYVASYHTDVGHYAADQLYFTAGYSSSPLYAYGNGEIAGGNGVYVYGSGFPNQSYQATNYWVDVMFDISTPSAVSLVHFGAGQPQLYLGVGIWVAVGAALLLLLSRARLRRRSDYDPLNRP